MEKHVNTYPPGSRETYGEAKSRNVRKRLFQGLVILFALVLLAAFNVGLFYVMLLWLPDATLLATLRDMEPADLVHRLHVIPLMVGAWAALIGTIVQLYRPQKRVAPLLMGIAFAIAVIAGQLATGTFDVIGALLFFVPLLLIALLHPRRGELFRFRRLDRAMLGLVIVAAIPLLASAYRHIQLQRLAVPGDTHAEAGHWAGMASYVLVIILWGLIGASDRPGWRLVAWVAGIAAAIYGLQSLLYPAAASTLSLPWAMAAVGWALVYVVAAERRARSAAKPKDDLTAQSV